MPACPYVTSLPLQEPLTPDLLTRLRREGVRDIVLRKHALQARCGQQSEAVEYPSPDLSRSAILDFLEQAIGKEKADLVKNGGAAAGFYHRCRIAARGMELGDIQVVVRLR